MLNGRFGIIITAVVRQSAERKINRKQKDPCSDGVTEQGFL